MDLKIVISNIELWPLVTGWLTFCVLAAFGIWRGTTRVVTCRFCGDDADDA